jgi:hypothetical protein
MEEKESTPTPTMMIESGELEASTMAALALERSDQYNLSATFVSGMSLISPSANVSARATV